MVVTLFLYQYVRTLRATFYGGALFGPAVVKWYQLLNRMQFSSPRKAVIYRVRLLLRGVASLTHYHTS